MWREMFAERAEITKFDPQIGRRGGDATVTVATYGGVSMEQLAQAVLSRPKAVAPAPLEVLRQAQPTAAPSTIASYSAPLRPPLWATTARWRSTAAPAETSSLRIGAVNDPLEREADRVADAVMSGTAIGSSSAEAAVAGPPGGDPTVRRACSCGTATPCTSCGTDTEPTLQRQADGGGATAAGARAPASVSRALAEPGRPLDAAVRSQLEPRLGADLTGVRVHTSATAMASAAAVGALAYTVGDSVVFGSGQYAPATAGGRRLLVHELAHVIQGRAGRQPLVRRAPADTTTSNSFTVAPNICNPAQTREIAPAVATAQQWLQSADTKLSTYAGSVGAAASAPTGASLTRHFAANDANTARYVQNIIRSIADRLRTDSGAPSPLNVQCHTSSDASCTGSGAYVSGANLVFCPGFFGASQAWGVAAMIHEIAHSIPTISGPLRITDRAYQSDRLYGGLSAGEALTNAESYALLVRELATTQVNSTKPRDDFDDCPVDWRRALDSAVARAQRWNRDAQTVLHDSRPAFLSQWTAQATTFLGGQTTAQLTSAASAYDRMESKLHDSIDFECESDGGGRCSSDDTYWYAAGHFHICPSWRNRPTDDDRAEGLLTGLYGYYGVTDDNARRLNLARLARALHNQFWAAPSAADVSGGLAAAAAAPQPPSAPAPGPKPSF
jgi:hypothetical protein